MSPERIVLAALAATLFGAGSAVAAPATGSIAGEVRWTGAAPARAALDRASDPVCARTQRTGEDVVVEAGRVRDVHVRLENGSAGTHAAPTAPAVVIQSECMYGPRVVGVVAGQPLEIRNADATFHNVRGNLGSKILWNLGQAAQQPPLTRKDLGKPGDVVSLHCDVHPWMAGWAVISDHPFFAVTGANGAFVLKDVPVGSYTVEAWHPTLGVKTAKVKVKKGKTTKAAFAFTAAK